VAVLAAALRAVPDLPATPEEPTPATEHDPSPVLGQGTDSSDGVGNRPPARAAATADEPQPLEEPAAIEALGPPAAPAATMEPASAPTTEPDGTPRPKPILAARPRVAPPATGVRAADW
jgi:hypothetical protein